jgi:hypothetical protein
MRFKALIVRTGVVLPPASGPARTAQCLSEGLQRLASAEMLYADAVCRLAPLLPRGWRDAPSPAGLDTPGKGALVAAAGRQRVRRWFRLARRVQRLREVAEDFGAGWVAAELDAIEQCSRAGLRAAADGYNFLEDASWDLPAATGLVSDDGIDFGSLRDALRRSHALVHVLGDTVGGLFGCELAYDDGEWFDECVTSLLHVRYGNSMGFTARHVCTVCDGDFAAYGHERDRTYAVKAARRADGTCTACGGTDCQHRPGDTMEVRATSVMSDITLHEVSLVPRPRDPLARITARQIDKGELEAFLGGGVDGGTRVLGHDCMHQCEGFRRPEASAHIDWDLM